MIMKKILVAFLAICMAVPVFAQTKYFGVKSGILKTVSDTRGQISRNTLWFDDFGRKQRQEIATDLGGELGVWVNSVLVIGDDVWSINQYGNAKKTKKGADVVDLNWYSLSQEAISRYDVKELRTETYAGKKCKVYSYKTKQLMAKVPVTVWVWEGIVLKQEIQKKTYKSTIELEDLQVNCKIPAGTFNKPAED